MDKIRRLTNLARKWLPEAVLILEFVNVVIELVSKVVNYDRKVS